jgi:nitrite reductase/ring-hydroxylating ferredoxin subunit
MTAGKSIVVAIDPDAPVGTILPAVTDNGKLVLVRHGRGWAAAVDSCPHAGCSLAEMGELFDETVLVCNCHGSEFDLLTGQVLRDPAEAPLQLLQTTPTSDGAGLMIETPA